MPAAWEKAKESCYRKRRCHDPGSVPPADHTSETLVASSIGSLLKLDWSNPRSDSFRPLPATDDIDDADQTHLAYSFHSHDADVASICHSWCGEVRQVRGG